MSALIVCVLPESDKLIVFYTEHETIHITTNLQGMKAHRNRAAISWKKLWARV